MNLRSNAEIPRAVILASYALGALALFSALDTVAAVLAIDRLIDGGPAFTQTAAALDLDGAEVAARELAEVRALLGYNVTIAAAAAILFGLLCFAVRRQSRIVRPVVWVAVALAAYAFGCGIGANPEATNPPDEQLALAWASLFPPWYSIVRSLLTLCEMLAVLSSALLLMRASVSEYYRNQQAEPGLGSYLVERQRKLGADDETVKR